MEQVYHVFSALFALCCVAPVVASPIDTTVKRQFEGEPTTPTVWKRFNYKLAQ